MKTKQWLLLKSAIKKMIKETKLDPQECEEIILEHCERKYRYSCINSYVYYDVSTVIDYINFTINKKR